MAGLSINRDSYSPQRMQGLEKAQRQAVVRKLAGEVVGMTFFGPMLQAARNSVFKGEYGHGGRGEDVFGSQLDQHLGLTLGQGTRNSLTEAIYRSMAEKV